jgi:hypothetical protein
MTALAGTSFEVVGAELRQIGDARFKIGKNHAR